MRVPFYDHVKNYQRRQAEIDGAIQRVLRSGRPDWGDEVPAFESEFGAWLGVPHVVTTNSGTAALKIALKASGIGSDDEVITVPNSDIATTSAIHASGAHAVLVDVEPETFTMDVHAFRRAITPRTKAVLPVDLWGQPADLPAISPGRKGTRTPCRRGRLSRARRHDRRPSYRAFRRRDLLQLCANEASRIARERGSLRDRRRRSRGAHAHDFSLWAAEILACEY